MARMEVPLSAAMAKRLRKRGYAVDCVYDGEKALELYGINEYDLMILDLNLPELDGLEVLRRIQKKDAELRMLILSAQSTVPDKIAGLDGGRTATSFCHRSQPYFSKRSVSSTFPCSKAISVLYMSKIHRAEKRCCS